MSPGTGEGTREVSVATRCSLSAARTIAWIAGRNSRPSSVSAYSADGGLVASAIRLTTPRAWSSRSRALSTRAEMPGRSFRSSPKRRG